MSAIVLRENRVEKTPGVGSPEKSGLTQLGGGLAGRGRKKDEGSRAWTAGASGGTLGFSNGRAPPPGPGGSGMDGRAGVERTWNPTAGLRAGWPWRSLGGCGNLEGTYGRIGCGAGALGLGEPSVAKPENAPGVTPKSLLVPSLVPSLIPPRSVVYEGVRAHCLGAGGSAADVSSERRGGREPRAGEENCKLAGVSCGRSAPTCSGRRCGDR